MHSLDVGDAYRRAVVSDVRGPFNLAADPALDACHVAAAYDARTVRVPLSAFRAAVAAAWHLRMQPTSPDWVDLLVRSPLLDTSRARRELGWAPVHSADAALIEFLEGMWRGAGAPTASLHPS